MSLRKIIEENEGEKEINHYSRTKNLIGVVESGISDLGQNHRKYLINKTKKKIAQFMHLPVKSDLIL
jgi:hypothetical protein